MIKNFARTTLKFFLPILERFFGFYTDPTGYLPNRLRMLLGVYESDITRLIQNLLPSQGVFVDIGANVGYISHFVLTKCRFQGKVVCIEPNPIVFNLLKRNIRASKRTLLYNFALGDITGTSTFYCGIDSAVGSLVKGYNESHHSSNPKWSSVKEIPVPVQIGDDLFSELDSIDVLKIDVEGFEIPAFYGMQKSIASKKIKNILMEFSPFSQRCAGRSPEQLISFFTERDYKVSGIEGEWNGVDINNKNLSKLISSLGDRGYTTLLVSA
jgi:FkbM family methyltransferase